MQCHAFLLFVLAGSWYTADVDKEVAEDLETGYVTPQSDAYTINGQPGDLCPCSSGTWRHTYRVCINIIFMKTSYISFIFWMNKTLYFSVIKLLHVYM